MMPMTPDPRFDEYNMWVHRTAQDLAKLSKKISREKPHSVDTYRKHQAAFTEYDYAVRLREYAQLAVQKYQQVLQNEDDERIIT